MLRSLYSERYHQVRMHVWFDCLSLLGQGWTMREEIRQLLIAHPFEQFTIFLSDGAQFDVSHPDQVLLTQSRVYVAKGDDVHRCSLLHVTRVATKETAT